MGTKYILLVSSLGPYPANYSHCCSFTPSSTSCHINFPKDVMLPYSYSCPYSTTRSCTYCFAVLGAWDRAGFNFRKPIPLQLIFLISYQVKLWHLNPKKSAIVSTESLFLLYFLHSCQNPWNGAMPDPEAIIITGLRVSFASLQFIACWKKPKYLCARVRFEKLTSNCCIHH